MIQILAIDDESKSLKLSERNSLVICLAWSPDGRRLVSGGIDRTVRIWETNTGMQCLVFKAHKDRINAISWSPDGNRLATASSDKTIKIWSNGKGVYSQKP